MGRVPRDSRATLIPSTQMPKSIHDDAKQTDNHSPFSALIGTESTNGRWIGYHLNFWFGTMPRSAAERGQQRQSDVEWFFRHFESRLIRTPAAAGSLRSRPFLIASPSLPVPMKHEPSTLTESLEVCRRIFLMPTGTHIGGRTLGEELDANQARYLRPKESFAASKLCPHCKLQASWWEGCCRTGGPGRSTFPQAFQGLALPRCLNRALVEHACELLSQEGEGRRRFNVSLTPSRRAPCLESPRNCGVPSKAATSSRLVAERW